MSKNNKKAEKNISELEKLIYQNIILEQFEKAYRYADQKMDLIIDKYLDMSDEDISLLSYLEAMIKDFKLVKTTLNVLYVDGDHQVDEKHLDLYGTLASALYHQDKKHNRRYKALLKQALKFKPDENHFGADNYLLNQAKTLLVDIDNE